MKIEVEKEMNRIAEYMHNKTITILPSEQKNNQQKIFNPINGNIFLIPF
ncbi:hypothetical protein V7128_12990 [Neobacillus vireti]